MAIIRGEKPLSKRTKPTVGDVVKFKTKEAAKEWWHKESDQFLVEEKLGDEYSLLGHKALGTADSGFAWVDPDDLEIVRKVDDETLDWLEEAKNGPEEDYDDD